MDSGKKYSSKYKVYHKLFFHPFFPTVSADAEVVFKNNRS